MNKVKVFYDIFTLIVIFLLSLLLSGFIFSREDLIKLASSGLMGVFAVLFIIFYSIAIIILGIRKSGKFSHGLAIFIGSLILPGLLPLFYYLTYLRKRMEKLPLNEQFKNLVKRIKENPEEFEKLK